jgi:hypothetical protein
MLVVGLGGGVALEGVPSSIHSIDVVELEPEIVEANRQVATQRRRDPLSDPRVRVSLDDARSALLLAAEDYDAIVSQPSHPWTSGSSHLFTREFFELARARLTADGVFVQWMGLRFVDAALLRTLVATLADVFEFVNVYQPIPGGVVLLGSDEPLGLGVESIAAIAADPDAFAQLGVFRTEDGVASLVLDAAGARAFAADAEINRDDRNWLQMRSLAVARGEREPRPAAAWSELDALLRLQAADFDLAAVVRRLLARGFEARARRVAEAIDDPAQRYAAEAWIALRSGRPVATRRALEASLSIDPGGAQARAAWLNLATRSRFAVDGAALAAPFVPTAADSALFDGWMAAHRRTWQPVRDIDAELAAVSPADPRFGLAARLRVAWRLASDAPGSAREAVPIAESLVPWSGAAGDLLLRARALAASGDEDAALATLFQVD